jgi:hypothetical protein
MYLEIYSGRGYLNDTEISVGILIPLSLSLM